MSEYISPTLGIIPENIVGLVSDAPHIGFSSFKTRMLVEQGYGILRSGILYSEFHIPGSHVGSDLYDRLVDFGFSFADVLSIVRIFAADNMLQSDLADLGFEIDSIVYGMDLPSRLKALGLVSRTVTARYALESSIIVYPLREIVPPPVYVPPPVPRVVYRSQATYTYSKGGKSVELRVWYQSYTIIEEKELDDKWNEANVNALKLPDSDLGNLLDSLSPDPGFEYNHPIDLDEIEGDLDTWYGRIVFRHYGKVYVYEVL